MITLELPEAMFTLWPFESGVSGLKSEESRESQERGQDTGPSLMTSLELLDPLILEAS